MFLVSDASVWVTSFARDEINHSLADQFVLDVWHGNHSIVVPSIFVTEVICGISRRFRHIGSDRVFLDAVERDLSMLPQISWKNVDRAFAREAAGIGAAYNLRGMDAIYAATAIFYDAPLLTEDIEFDRASDAIRILRLRDVVSQI